MISVQKVFGLLAPAVVNLYCTGVALNFSTWFMKNILFEQEEINIWNKQYCVENKTEIMQHVIKML